MTPLAHLQASLALLDVVEGLGGAHSASDSIRALIDRPGDLPSEIDETDSLLKYDAYLACGGRPGWGITINDRWEGPGFAALVDGVAGRLGIDLTSYDAMRGELDGASPALTVSFGFGDPASPPRMKLYLQEDRWQSGVASVAGLRAAVARCLPTIQLPSWLADEVMLGVVTITLRPDAGASLKAYVGAATALDAARGAPESAQALARDMTTHSPLAPAYHYLTIRADEARPARYAINKIYNPVGVLKRRDRTEAEAQWRDVQTLFEASGRGASLAELRRALDGVGDWLLPTATALEDGSRSSDVYLAAW
jgi:hypothetical protein